MLSYDALQVSLNNIKYISRDEHLAQVSDYFCPTLLDHCLASH